MKEYFSYTKIVYYLKNLPRKMWFRSFLYGIIGIATAIVGLFAGHWVPLGFVTKIGSDAVGNILAILASSMLAVSTFSLSILVTAFGNVATNATPRASKLLIENQNAQGAIATFIGAFLYSVVGIVALATNAYGEQGRFVLFIVTIGVIMIIIISLIRWVDRLSTLGQLGHTIDQVEKATMEVFRKLTDTPHFGCNKKTQSFNGKIQTKEVGFIAFINFDTLQKICERENIHLAIELLPGSFVYPDEVIAITSQQLSNKIAEEIVSHFVIKTNRTFDQDPRFGLVLISEIASRALSPGINDPGTAIEIISTGTRLLKEWSDLNNAQVNYTIKFDRIFVPSFDPAKLMEDVFSPIARNGSGHIEVCIKLMRALQSLSKYDSEKYSNAAATFSSLLMAHAKQTLKTEYELSLLENV